MPLRLLSKVRNYRPSMSRRSDVELASMFALAFKGSRFKSSRDNGEFYEETFSDLV